MFALALALDSAAPTAVEATGMEPQIRIVLQEASKREWPITCVGHAGEEGVVRVGIPSGVAREIVDGFIEAVTPIASSVGNVSGSVTSMKTCDREPVKGGGSEVVRTLTFTTEPDARLLAAAQQCGFAKAYWRPANPEDFAKFSGRLDTKKYSITLDAGENFAARYGPMICFLNIGLTPLVRRNP